MNTKAIRQLADVTLDKYRSSIPRKAFEEFVKDIIAGENRATAFRYEVIRNICRCGCLLPLWRIPAGKKQ